MSRRAVSYIVIGFLLGSAVIAVAVILGIPFNCAVGK